MSVRAATQRIALEVMVDADEHPQVRYRPANGTARTVYPALFREPYEALSLGEQTISRHYPSVTVMREDVPRRAEGDAWEVGDRKFEATDVADDDGDIVVIGLKYKS
ncbi:MAG: hypothetical protein AAGA68_26715 [Pseudomonadota bacterium]